MKDKSTNNAKQKLIGILIALVAVAGGVSLYLLTSKPGQSANQLLQDRDVKKADQAAVAVGLPSIYRAAAPEEPLNKRSEKLKRFSALFSQKSSRPTESSPWESFPKVIEEDPKPIPNTKELEELSSTLFRQSDMVSPSTKQAVSFGFNSFSSLSTYKQIAKFHGYQAWLSASKGDAQSMSVELDKVVQATKLSKGFGTMIEALVQFLIADIHLKTLQKIISKYPKLVKQYKMPSVDQYGFASPVEILRSEYLFQVGTAIHAEELKELAGLPDLEEEEPKNTDSKDAKDLLLKSMESWTIAYRAMKNSQDLVQMCAAYRTVEPRMHKYESDGETVTCGPDVAKEIDGAFLNFQSKYQTTVRAKG